MIAYRWGDLLLLRAEANAALNKISESLVDLNEVRDRAGLEPYDGPKDKIAVEKEICDERLRELFIEQNDGLIWCVSIVAGPLTFIRRCPI